MTAIYWVRPGIPALILAPMEGVTDAPMRAFLAERGGISVCVTDFLRVSQQPLPARVVRRHFQEIENGCETQSGVPVILQLLGGDPERLAETAKNAIQAGANGIDLNFGCPAPTVNRNDGGAVLLKAPLRIQNIVRAVRDAVPAKFPVSAKLRLGWDHLDAIDECAMAAQVGGASWITIHARTKVAGYAPPAYWDRIARVKESLEIPIVANGDIWTVEDYRRCRAETGCEHFMLGRGLIADPDLALQIWRSENPTSSHFVSDFDWSFAFKRFSEISIQFGSTEQGLLRRLKQWARMAHQRGRFSSFESIKDAQSLVEFMDRMEGLSKTSGRFEFSPNFLCFERNASAI